MEVWLKKGWWWFSSCRRRTRSCHDVLLLCWRRKEREKRNVMKISRKSRVSICFEKDESVNKAKELQFCDKQVTIDVRNRLIVNSWAFSPYLSSLCRRLRAQGGVRSFKAYLDRHSMTILFLARFWHPCLCRDSWIRICKRFYHLKELCEIHTLAVFEVGGASKRFMKCRANFVFYVLLTQIDEIVHEVAERHLGLSVRCFFSFI